MTKPLFVLFGTFFLLIATLSTAYHEQSHEQVCIRGGGEARYHMIWPPGVGVSCDGAAVRYTDYDFLQSQAEISGYHSMIVIYGLLMCSFFFLIGLHIVLKDFRGKV